MKKKLLGCLAVLAIAAVAAWNVNFNSQKNLMSDIALANVEALASEIIGNPTYCMLYCPVDPYWYCNVYEGGAPKATCPISRGF